MQGRTLRSVFLAIILTLCPYVVLAQTAGTIAGEVKDTSGAVLPGVTVEAASPALIEKVRSVVTDSSGQYKIVDLRPGTYSVTFTLTGFATVKREDVDLAAGFTATVNGELRVGSLQETIVVTGQSPVVDVQNVEEQRVLTRDVLDVTPTAKTLYNLASLLPGMTVMVVSTAAYQDVGGTGGDNFQGLSIHGSLRNDGQTLIDGMSVAFTGAFAGSMTATSLGDGTIEEAVLGVSGHAAEIESGGVVANFVPKQGGNNLSGSFFGNFATQGTQSNNYDSTLKAEGLATPLPIKSFSDVNPAFGGPIVRDRLWFFVAYRDKRSNIDENPATKGYNLNPTGWVFVPDLTNIPVQDQLTVDSANRLTWQATAKNRLALTYDYNHKLEHHAAGGNFAADQATYIQSYQSNISQVTWSAPFTNRLLLDAGMSLTPIYHTQLPNASAVPVSATELTTGETFRSPAFSSNINPQSYLIDRETNYVFRGSVSYVTGAHAVKFGVTQQNGHLLDDVGDLADYQVSLINGNPSSVTFLPTPYRSADYFYKFAAFGQDQWRLGHMTINAGLRFDSLRTSYPDYQIAPTPILPARSFPGADVLSWTDLSPRLGVAYDLFGNGKTAVKASASRYVNQQALDLTKAIDPVATSGAPLTRTWVDANHDFVPQGDPLNPAANGELGPSPNNNFGKVSNLSYAPSFANGFDVRPYEWEFTSSLQHELIPQVSVSAAYFRRIFGNLTVTDNTLVAAGDYNPFCVSAPQDSRLPGGGGQQICGLYDLNPSKLGQLQNLVTTANTYGKEIDHWQGFDFTVNARLQKLVLQGGLSTGKEITDNCAVFNQVPENGTIGPFVSTVAGPLAGPYCHQETPYLTQVKFLGSYSLPWSLQASATLQSIPGNEILATYVATNAQIAPSLGRNLSAGATATASVNLIAPYTDFLPRINQMDVRFTRIFKLRAVQIKGMVDLYNVLNNNVVLVANNTYGTNGSSWQVPTQILSARLLKLGLQINFR